MGSHHKEDFQSYDSQYTHLLIINMPFWGIQYLPFHTPPYASQNASKQDEHIPLHIYNHLHTWESSSTTCVSPTNPFTQTSLPSQGWVMLHTHYTRHITRTQARFKERYTNHFSHATLNQDLVPQTQLQYTKNASWNEENHTYSTCKMKNTMDQRYQPQSKKRKWKVVVELLPLPSNPSCL